MSEKKIKVTDKRLFNADGELRDEYRHLVDEDESNRVDAGTRTPAEPEPPPAARREEEVKAPDVPPKGQETAPPTFFDLVGVVAQPIALYLGDAKMPNGETMENLELARLYIDLLEVLEKKSEGNLTADEKGFLVDLLYQLRLRYVEKSS